MAAESHGDMAKAARQHTEVPCKDTATAIHHSFWLAVEVDAPRSMAVPRSVAESHPLAVARPSDLTLRSADSAKAAPEGADRASAEAARLAKRSQRRCVRNSPR